MELEYKDRIKKLRKEKGVTQQQLADAIFVSRSAVAKWENGLGLPSKESREALAEFFEVSDDYFSVAPIENIIVEKNKKIVFLKCAVALALLAACVFVALLLFNGYSFTADGLTGNDHQGKYTFTSDEYTFSGIAWEVEGSDDKLFDLFYAIEKRGILYHRATPECSYLYTEEGSPAAYLEKYAGKNKDYYFIKFMQTVSAGDLARLMDGDGDGAKTTYRMFSNKITVNGKEIGLKDWSFFELDGPLETIEICGRKLEMRMEPEGL